MSIHDYDDAAIAASESEQIKGWFDKFESDSAEDADDNEFMEFERIPLEARLHQNRYLCAQLKAASLLLNANDFTINADHDQLYFGYLDKLGDITEDDVLYLVRCGVSWLEDNECMSMFV